MANKGSLTVYALCNEGNGRMYVGATTNLEKRHRDHLSQLRRGHHSNQHLQADWNDGRCMTGLELVVLQSHANFFDQTEWVEKLW